MRSYPSCRVSAPTVMLMAILLFSSFTVSADNALRSHKRVFPVVNFANDSSKLTRQARAVVEYLVQQGISRQRLALKAVSESQPMQYNSDESGRAGNRRVVFMEK